MDLQKYLKLLSWQLSMQQKKKLCQQNLPHIMSLLLSLTGKLMIFRIQ